MSRRLKAILGALLVAVALGVIYLRGLHQRVLRLARPEPTEQLARRELTQPPLAAPTDLKTKARIFWASPVRAGTLEPVELELSLSPDPGRRGKQLLQALIADAPTPEQRTLPAEVALLEFYLLADGTAIADFSDVLASATPSGILSEQMAVESVVRTLEVNVEPVRRLKILIHGQEAETIAGHVDLTGLFEFRAPPSAPASAPALQKPQSGLTASRAPGKLRP